MYFPSLHNVDISPLQKLYIITCEEGEFYFQGSELGDPNLSFRWGCKEDLIQFQSSSQTDPFLKNPTSLGSLEIYPIIKLQNLQVFPHCLHYYLTLLKLFFAKPNKFIILRPLGILS